MAVGEGAARASAKDTLYFALTESIGGEYAKQVCLYLLYRYIDHCHVSATRSLAPKKVGRFPM